MKRVVRYWMLPWIALVLLYGAMAGMLHFRVQHPHFLPICVVLALLFGATLVVVFGSLFRLLVGPERRHALTGLLWGVAPILLFGAHFVWGLQAGSGRNPPLHYGLKVLAPLGESLMDLEARFRYPVRTYGEKVVMIHAGLPNANEQVAAMDRHLEQIEVVLGKPVRGRGHWVRGQLLGMSHRCLYGVALGSNSNTTKSPEELSTLDRHELAHWAIGSHGNPYAELAPSFLVEGWAETQSGYNAGFLQYRLAEQRESGEWMKLSEFLKPDWRHRSEYGAYTQGGPVVEYLLRRFGGPKFYELYHHCAADTLDADLQRVLGISLAQLEADFWEELQQQQRRYTSLRHWFWDQLPVADTVDPAKWRAFVADYTATVGRLEKENPDLRGEAHFSWRNRPNHDEEPSEISQRTYRYVKKGTSAMLHSTMNGTEFLLLANPEGGLWSLDRKNPTDRWIHRPQFEDRQREYKNLSQRIQNQVWFFEPSKMFWNDLIWSLMSVSNLEVAKLNERENQGKRFLEIEVRERVGSNLKARSHFALRPDLKYAAEAVESEHWSGRDFRKIQSRIEFVGGTNSPRMRSIKTRTLDNTGAVIGATKIDLTYSEPQAGEAPFSLATYGIDETSIDHEPVAEANRKAALFPEQKATSWPLALGATWILLAILERLLPRKRPNAIN